jgi:hypothetical protein
MLERMPGHVCQKQGWTAYPPGLRWDCPVCGRVWRLDVATSEWVPLVHALEPIGDEIIDAVGVDAAVQILEAITRPEADRVTLTRRLKIRADAQWLADLLVELEVDEPVRVLVAEALRVALTPRTARS